MESRTHGATIAVAVSALYLYYSVWVLVTVRDALVLVWLLG